MPAAGVLSMGLSREQLPLCETRVCVCVTHHALKADPVKVLGPVVPEDVSGTVRTRSTPVLYLRHLEVKGVEVVGGV